MFNTLLCLGLIASAFAFFPSADLREIKMAAAIVFALSLGMVELYKHGFKPLRNKWLAALLVYIPISIIFAPVPTINLVGIDVSNFWAWQPFAYILVFAFMGSAIASHEFTLEEMQLTFKTISWCGFLTAAYVILQRLHMDQFFIATTSEKVGAYAGFIGNPTLTAPFIAMTVPFMIYNRKWWMLPFALASIVITDSQMAYGGFLAGMLFWVAAKGRIRFVVTTVIGMTLFLGLVLGYSHSEKVRNFVVDNERFVMWKQAMVDLKSPVAPPDMPNSFPLTGRGLGSFKYVFHIQHPGTEIAPNRFHQAHNEYVELAYSIGLIGICLFLMAILTMILGVFSIYHVFLVGEDERAMTILSSFIIVAVVAAGTFIWQIGTTAYYSVVLVGLMHNPIFQKRGK